MQDFTNRLSVSIRTNTDHKSLRCIFPLYVYLRTDQEPAIPALVNDILARLLTFLQTLPPGLVDKERDLSDRLTQTREYLELVQVIQRSESRLLAGIGPLPSVNAQVAHPQAEDDEEKDEGSHEVDFGFRVRVKKSKVKKVKKEERARTITIDVQKEQQVSDETFLKKGSYPIPRDSLDIRDLKGCARRRLARVYVVSISFMFLFTSFYHVELTEPSELHSISRSSMPCGPQHCEVMSGRSLSASSASLHHLYRLHSLKHLLRMKAMLSNKPRKSSKQKLRLKLFQLRFHPFSRSKQHVSLNAILLISEAGRSTSQVDLFHISDSLINQPC